jgi:hypothetical protein
MVTAGPVARSAKRIPGRYPRSQSCRSAPVVAVGVAVMTAALSGGCASTGTSAGHDAGSGATSPANSRIAITSTIKNAARLSGAVGWTVNVPPGTDATGVVFAIDGKNRWIEHHPPYTFNDDHGLLSTYLLANGAHTLPATVITSDGVRVATSSHVTVANHVPAIPRRLLGTWRRTLTEADQSRTRAQPDYTGQDMPKGVWTLTFTRNGLVRITDPTGAGLDYQASATRHGQLTAYGPANWILVFPAENSPLYGYFCQDIQEARDSFTWVRQAGQLRISGGSTCSDRDALFDGNWKGGR